MLQAYPNTVDLFSMAQRIDLLHGQCANCTERKEASFTMSPPPIRKYEVMVPRPSLIPCCRECISKIQIDKSLYRMTREGEAKGKHSNSIHHQFSLLVDAEARMLPKKLKNVRI
jgi:hypothetical protein